MSGARPGASALRLPGARLPFEAPLWLRLTLALLAALIVVAFASGELTRQLGEQQVFRDLRHQNDKTFAVLAPAAREALAGGHASELDSALVETARLEPDIEAIYLADRHGEALVGWSRSKRVDPRAVVPLSKHIELEGQPLGSLHIFWDRQALEEVVDHRVHDARLQITGSLLALTLLIIALVHGLAVKPIQKVHARLLALASGDLETRLHLRGSRELSLLAVAVNDLCAAVELQRRRELELERARQALFEAKELAEVTLQSIGEGVIATDPEGRVRYLNPIAETLCGWPAREARGRSLEEVFRAINEVTRTRITNPVLRCLHRGIVSDFAKQTLLLSRQGVEYAIEETAAPIRARDGTVLGVVIAFRDVTEARRLTREIAYHASHDVLTGLANRREFERRLEDFVHSAARGSGPHSLLYLDIDQFRIVNDTCGHTGGDALLRAIAKLLEDRVRASDTFARLGGDEFAVLLSECPLEQACALADALREAIAGFRFTWQGRTFTVSGSIGVVAITADAHSAERVLRAADEACYAAKDAGRNRVHAFSLDDAALAERRGEMQWVPRVRAALEEGRLELYCQPIARTNRGGESGGLHYELLLRLRDEHGSPVAPTLFLPAAERYGLMPLIDKWVIARALEWLAANPGHLDRLKLCAINVSGTSLCEPGFLDYAREHLRASGVPGHKLCIEVTETATVANLMTALEFVTAMRALGARFALDDFGTGMSSFAYLKTLPVDFLKIDGSFVRDALADPVSLTLVRSINEIGRAMGMCTVAECVETEELLAALREVGVDYVQGYCISRPFPLEELADGRAMTACARAPSTRTA